MSELVIRGLQTADIPLVDPVLIAAYAQPSRAKEMQRHLAFQPDGWLLAERDGEVLGMVGAVDYGTFASVGLMAVHPAAQRQGIARALFARLLDWLDARGCPNAMLDASLAGAPLYEAFGFVDEGRTRQFVHESPPRLSAPFPAGVTRMSAADLPAVTAFDTPIFGGDRGRLLATFQAENPERALLARDERGEICGMLFAQERIIGPWVASSPAAARALLTAALTLPYTAPIRVLVPDAATALDPVLEEHGFRLMQSLRHMRRGTPAPRQMAQIYGLGSHAIG